MKELLRKTLLVATALSAVPGCSQATEVRGKISEIGDASGEPLNNEVVLDRANDSPTDGYNRGTEEEPYDKCKEMDGSRLDDYDEVDQAMWQLTCRERAPEDRLPPQEEGGE